MNHEKAFWTVGAWAGLIALMALIIITAFGNYDDEKLKELNQGSWQCIENEKRCVNHDLVVKYHDSCDGIDFTRCICDFDINHTSKEIIRFCFTLDEVCEQEEITCVRESWSREVKT